MSGLLLVIVSFFGYIIMYRLYGRFIGNKIFNLSNANEVPSVALRDDIDYVPTKKSIIFGHHFASIAGTGPIVGPAIAIIWGWLPAMIWVFVGSIFMGAVHDLGALVLSLRNEGKSISEITEKYMNKRSKFIFFVVVFFELWIVIAIFGLIIALIFAMFPEAVLAVWLQIPIAIALGYIVYKRNGNLKLSTAVAVIVMYATMVLGHYLPLTIPAIAGIPSTGIWSILLFIYAFVASSLPVTTLLQPRDYINTWQLIISMVLIIGGIIFATFKGGLNIVAPAVQAHPQGAPPMMPFLYITIACGAVSGFHALVGSGTSSKQLSSEKDALFVGYGSMLTESFLAVLVIVAVSAGIGLAYKTGNGQLLTGAAAWEHHYASWGASAGLGSKISAFIVGSGNMIETTGIPRVIAVIIMGVFVASFAGTTLDTATRLQRYIIQEISRDIRFKPTQGKYGATAFAVITAAILAFSGGADGNGALSLWPLFGVVNQTLAALSLIVITLYLKKKGGFKWLVSGIPAVFMCVMSVWGIIINEINFINDGRPILYVTNAIIAVLTVVIIFEGIKGVVRKAG